MQIIDSKVLGLNGRAVRSRRTNGIVLSFFLSVRNWLIEKSPATGFRLRFFAYSVWRPVPDARSRMSASFGWLSMNSSTSFHGFCLVASKWGAILLYVSLRFLRISCISYFSFCYLY